MSRRVLTITAGGTPQVVTETLHHLATRAAWWPDEVVLMTTRFGDNLYRDGDARLGVEALLGPGGRLARLVAEVERPMPEVRVVVASDGAGAPIDDIRSEAEVTAFANGLLAEVRQATAGDGELHLSLAGGRKTMSYLAGAVLSLYGRPRDTLSHVLVEPKTLEAVPAFWWPGQRDPADGVDRAGRPWSAAAARTHLHAVPFVRLRAHLRVDRVFERGDLSFADAVERANAALLAEVLTVDTPGMAVVVGGARVAIGEPMQFALYRFLAEARKEGLSVAGRPPGALHFADLLLETDAAGRRLLERLGDTLADVWRRGKGVDGLRAEQERERFLTLTPRGGGRGRGGTPPTPPEILARRLGPHVSDLRKALREGLLPHIADRASPVAPDGRRGVVMIDWDAEKIGII